MTTTTVQNIAHRNDIVWTKSKGKSFTANDELYISEYSNLATTHSHGPSSQPKGAIMLTLSQHIQQLDEAQTGTAMFAGSDVFTKQEDGRWFRREDNTHHEAMHIASFHGHSGYSLYRFQ